MLQQSVNLALQGENVMAHIKENDLMQAFYLAKPPLQKQILSEYQNQAAKNNNGKNLLVFLEEQFRPELTMRPNSVTENPQHIST